MRIGDREVPPGRKRGAKRVTESVPVACGDIVDSRDAVPVHESCCRGTGALLHVADDVGVDCYADAGQAERPHDDGEGQGYVHERTRNQHEGAREEALATIGT